jgi:hypothetical protein
MWTSAPVCGSTRVLEAQAPEDPLEPLGVGSADEQVEVVLAARGLRDRLVALPVAVPHALDVEGTAERGDQPEDTVARRLASIGLGAGRHEDRRHAEAARGILGLTQVHISAGAQGAVRSDIPAPPRSGYRRTLCENTFPGTGTMT